MSADDQVTPDGVEQFRRLSEVLTGYDEYALLGTGMMQRYYNELARNIGERELGSLLGAFARSGSTPDCVRKAILDDARYGPVARNIIGMWYLAVWNQLPREWRNTYGATSYDTDHVISAAAYRASLVWPTAGTHPMGARQPGFGSWAEPPTFQES
jgi:hypothetical protein